MAVNLVLIKDEHGQVPVYYTSRAIHRAELRYPPLEKLAFTLITMTRKLMPYFQSHQIVILTNQPLKVVLQKPEVSGRLVKWAVELGEFDICYRPKTAIKGQVLADFLVELTLETCEKFSPSRNGLFTWAGHQLPHPVAWVSC